MLSYQWRHQSRTGHTGHLVHNSLLHVSLNSLQHGGLWGRQRKHEDKWFPSYLGAFCMLGTKSKGRDGERGQVLTSVILQRALMAGPLYTSSFPVMSLVRLEKTKQDINQIVVHQVSLSCFSAKKRQVLCETPLCRLQTCWWQWWRPRRCWPSPWWSGSTSSSGFATREREHKLSTQHFYVNKIPG